MKTATGLPALLLLVLLLTGCTHRYVTPGGGAAMFDIVGSEFDARYQTDGTGASIQGNIERDFEAYYERKPAAHFPANVAVLRVQDSGYHSHSYHAPGYGRFSVITTRDIEADDAFDGVLSLSGIRQIAPIGRMLIGPNPNSVKDLRAAAAQLHADMILIYTVDTSFTVDGKELGPLSVISLGLIPIQKAHVTATVSGILVDVRTGFIYGATEATDKQEQRASIWSTGIAIDTARLKAEKTAFADFVVEVEALWPGIVQEHRGRIAARAPGDTEPSGYHVVRFDDWQ